MTWKVQFSKKASKQFQALPQSIQLRLRALVLELEAIGPVRGNWKNYGKLNITKHHCHLKTRHPTYVACWETIGKEVRLIEVYYAGTHEKASY